MIKQYIEAFGRIKKYNHRMLSIMYSGTNTETLTYENIYNNIIIFQSTFGTSDFTKMIGIKLENSNKLINAIIATIYSGYIPVIFNPDVDDKFIMDVVKENNLDYIIDQKFNLFLKKDNKKMFSTPKFIIPKTNDIIAVTFTSGSTGEYGKGVLHTLKNLCETIKNYKEMYKMSESQTIFTALPIWHNFGLFACLFTTLFSNSKLIFTENWNLDLFIKAYEENKITIFPTSPYMLIDIVSNLKQMSLNNIKICDSGGDFIPKQYQKRFFEMMNASIVQGYGLTETTSLTHFNKKKLFHPSNIGAPVENVVCKIKDHNGNDLKENKWGVLWLSGAMVSPGYLNKTQNKSSFSGKWFNTGDIVKKCDGEYYLAGRLGDLKYIDLSLIDSILDLKHEIYENCNIWNLHIATIGLENNKIVLNIYLESDLRLDSSMLVNLVKKYQFFFVNKITIADKLSKTKTGKVKRIQVVEEHDKS